MNFIKPTYRLSRLQFFLYTLAFYVFVAIVGFIMSATGGSGGWIVLLSIPVLFFLYLHYIVRPRLQDMGRSQWWALTVIIPLLIPVGANLYIHWWAVQFLSPVIILCMMLILLFFPGKQSADQDSTTGVPKAVAIGAGLLAAPIILVGGFVTAIGFVLAISTCFVSAWGCEDYGSIGSLRAETEVVRSAMYAMMADKNITTVTRNDNHNGRLGVNTWTGLPEGPGASSLDAYLKRATTKFYYCWNSQGDVYAQNKKDGVIAEPDDAEKQRHCKSSFADPTAQIAEPEPSFLTRQYNRVFRRNLLVITNSKVKPSGRLVTYGPEKAPFNYAGFIVIAAGEEAVRLPGPPVPANGQATQAKIEDLFKLEDHRILRQDDGFTVFVNSRLRYKVSLGDYKDAVHLSRVEVKRRDQVLESVFTFLAHPSGERGMQVRITPIVDRTRLPATQTIGLTVRLDRPNVETYIEEYRLLPIDRTNISPGELARKPCVRIVAYRPAKTEGGVFVMTTEELPVAVGDYIEITDSIHYNGRWEVLEVDPSGSYEQFRINKQWPGPLSEGRPKVCAD